MDDDDSCVMKYIEIVPLDSFSNHFDLPNVKLSPCHIKVCGHLFHVLMLLSSKSESQS